MRSSGADLQDPEEGPPEECAGQQHASPQARMQAATALQDSSEPRTSAKPGRPQPAQQEQEQMRPGESAESVSDSEAASLTKEQEAAAEEEVLELLTHPQEVRGASAGELWGSGCGLG